MATLIQGNMKRIFTFTKAIGILAVHIPGRRVAGPVL
jgi:hypothetical protein